MFYKDKGRPALFHDLRHFFGEHFSELDHTHGIVVGFVGLFDGFFPILQAGGDGVEVDVLFHFRRVLFLALVHDLMP